MTLPSPLELLHPEGRVERVLLLGEHCARWMQPHAATQASLDVDLAVIAPSPADLRRSGWLERAVGDAARGLAPAGLIYALVPRGNRRTARRHLRQAGLVLEPPLVELPGHGPPRYLLPLQVEPWRHALARQIEARPRARVALRAARALPLGGPILADALPAVAIVARRPRADPLMAWVERLGGGTRPVAHAVVATSWRGPHGPIVLHCFAAAEAEPWGVAKVSEDSATESDLLDRLAVAARAAGARVPRPLATGRVAGGPVLVETVLAGRPAAELLREAPHRFAEIVAAICSWQERWNRATRGTGEPEPEPAGGGADGRRPPSWRARSPMKPPIEAGWRSAARRSPRAASLPWQGTTTSRCGTSLWTTTVRSACWIGRRQRPKGFR